MDAVTLLHRARKVGLRVEPMGDRLVVRGRTNRLPDPLRQTLARRRERGTCRIGARTTPP